MRAARTVTILAVAGIVINASIDTPAYLLALAAVFVTVVLFAGLALLIASVEQRPTPRPIPDLGDLPVGDDLMDVADATNVTATRPYTAELAPYEKEIADLDDLLHRLRRHGGAQ